jgi:putative ABC transport system permease protein
MRLYRALLYLYPQRFREEYAEELCRAFAERAREMSSVRRAVAALADVLPNAIAAHWDVLRHGTAVGTTWPAYGSDIRFAFRQIAATPLLSSVIVSVLALGIGINAGLLTVIDTYAWQPAPGIPRDASLARLLPVSKRQGDGRIAETTLSYPELLDLRTRRDVFADVAGWTAGTAAVDFGAGPETLRVWYTTGNFFRLLRVPLAAGSGFPDDVDRTSAPIAIITHSLWQTRFGGSTDAIGKTIRVMNQPLTIVGVAPLRFSGIDAQNFGQPAIWVPLGARTLLEPDAERNTFARGTTILRTVARLAQGVSPDDIEHRVAPLAAHLAQSEPTTHADLAIRGERLTGLRPSGDRMEALAAVFLVATLIVVITCTNVSALLLGRAAARRREIAIRLALGATRRRVIRQLFTESLVFAVCGALLSLALYLPSMKVAYAMMPNIVYGLAPQPATFLYAALFAGVATIVFGLAPALHATNADIGEAMKNSGSAAIRRSRLQALFVIIQLACSQPVLVVTSLVLADIRATVNNDAGRAPASVMTMSWVMHRSETEDAEVAARGAIRSSATNLRELETIRERVKLVPGVVRAAVTSRGMAQASVVRSRREETFQLPDGGTSARLRSLYVSAEYFDALEIPLRRGRAITSDDDRPGSVAIVVNEAAADALWPRENPIGKRLLRRVEPEGRSRPFEVIGVVGKAPYDASQPDPMVFAPLSTAESGWLADFTVRTAGDARAYLPRIRAAVREIEPYIALGEATTLAEQYEGQRRDALQSNAAAFAIGAAALLLASLGLYAIIAHAVAQRTREIGVRLAMGASPARVVKQFFGDGVRISAIGLAIGLPATVIAIRVIKASVLGFTVQNVAAVMVVVPVLLGVAAFASWLPARRAARVDPLIALRAE